MSIFHILRLLLAIVLAGVAGWLSLLAFNAVKLMQEFEAFEAAVSDGGGDARPFVDALARAIGSIQGGSALFVAAGIAGVVLSEVFRTRSLLFYAGATGALTAALAAALWRQPGAAGNAQAALAMAGFVAGAVYWMIAGSAVPRG